VELLGLPLATSGSRPACPRLHSLADSRSRGDLRDGQIGAAGEDGRCPADIAGIFQARDPGSRLQVPPRSEEREQSGNCEGGKREGGTDTATYIQAIVPPRCISCSVASSVGTAPMSSLDFDRRGGGGLEGGTRDRGSTRPDRHIGPARPFPTLVLVRGCCRRRWTTPRLTRDARSSRIRKRNRQENSRE
jgi:hypothetical protein